MGGYLIDAGRGKGAGCFGFLVPSDEKGSLNNQYDAAAESSYVFETALLLHGESVPTRTLVV